MERWRRSGRQTAFRDIELVDLGAKPGCLEFLLKAGLDQIPVVAPLMMMMIPNKDAQSDMWLYVTKVELQLIVIDLIGPGLFLFLRRLYEQFSMNDFEPIGRELFSLLAFPNLMLRRGCRLYYGLGTVTLQVSAPKTIEGDMQPRASTSET